MEFLTGLHGAVAAVLLSSLLFIDELGVPMPLAPNEVLLLIAGLLIAGGALPPELFLPLAVAAMTAGMLVGFGWARAVGPERLRGFASRLGAAEAYDRTAERIHRARPVDIAIARLLPGVRPYVTLIAGGTGMPLRVFLRGALPAIVIWAGVFTLLGTLVGIPAEHVLNRFEKLGATGGLLAILGIGEYIAARRVPPGQLHDSLVGEVPPRWRVLLAVVLDSAIVLSLVAGLDRITRSFVHRFSPNSLNELIIFVGAIVLAYVILSRRLRGETAGERIFGVSYLRRRLPGRGRPPVTPEPGMQAGGGDREHRPVAPAEAGPADRRLPRPDR